MSQKNLETLRRSLDAFNRRDRAASLALCEAELENIPPGTGRSRMRSGGREAVWDFFVEGNTPWEEGSFDAFEVVEVGDKVAMDLRREVRGKPSGAAVPWRYWSVATFDDGKLVRLEWFTDRAEALEAAGLSE
jgi:ketosteroid isomerase-like protein